VINFLLFHCKVRICNLIVDKIKYLGHNVHHDNTDDCDIMREIRNLYSRINILNRRFQRCSVDVKFFRLVFVFVPVLSFFNFVFFVVFKASIYCYCTVYLKSEAH